MKSVWVPLLAASLLLLSIAMPSIGINAQPVQNGHLVGTCYSGTNPGGFVVGLYDVRTASLQPLNTNWNPPVAHGPTNNWTAANLGQVFGVDFDAAGDIYLTATRVYAQYSPPGGPGGSGAVYRIDGVTGAISTFVSTLAAPCGTVVGTSTMPNTGVGLGNIAHDPLNNQFFVTNFEDGKIYRISAAGTILSAFDPFVPDACVAGWAPLGERLWGVNVYNNRVYFSRWVEDMASGNFSATTFNEIWSVALDGSGNFTGAATLDIQVPNLSFYQYSNPVSDIAFSASGKMLLAERSMNGNANDPYFPSAHQSRLLEYVLVSGTWVASSSSFSIGIGGGTNTAGGCDYGYRSYNQQTRSPEECDSTVWASGDALHLASADAIYGWAQLPASGGGNANAVLIDADADINSGDKLQIGDLEIYKSCAGIADDPCKGIRVSSKQIESPTGEQSCCHDLTISGLTAGTYSSVSAQLLDDSITFTGVIGPAGWGVTNTGVYATWDSLGMIPGGTITGLQFCLYSIADPPQRVEIVLHGLDGSLCRDTLTFDCPKLPPPFPPCALIAEQQITCKETGPNGSVYDLSFVVTNQSPFSLPPYSLPAANLVVYPVTPNVYVAPGAVTFGSPLGYSASSGPLPFTISGPGAQPGDTVCIVVQLHGAKLEHDYRWCCPPDTLCFVLPSCKECCEGVDIRFGEVEMVQQGNYGLSLNASGVSVTPGPITSATATVMSVTSSNIWCPKKKGSFTYVNTGGAGPLLAQVTGGSIAPSLPLSYGITPPTTGVGWGTVPAGVAMNSGTVNLNLQLPGSRLGWRCRDTLTVCVRYSFTDTACRTCDTVVYYTIPRLGTLDIAPVDPVFGGISQVKRVGETPLLTPESTGGGTALYQGRAGHDLHFDLFVEDDQRITGPELDLEITAPGQATLSATHWWPDGLEGEPDVVLGEMFVRGAPGFDITSIREVGGGSGEVIEGEARITVDLKKGETDRYLLTFKSTSESLNYAKIIWTWNDGDIVGGGDWKTSREFFVPADLAQGRDTTRLTVRKDIDKSTPYLYKVTVSAGNYDTTAGLGAVRWMAPESIRLSLPEGVRAIAAGPLFEESNPLFRFARGRIDKATPVLYQGLSGSRSGDEEWLETTLAPNESTTLTLVVVGENAAGPFDLQWEGINGEGDVIAVGTIRLDTVTSSIGEEVTPGGSVYILQAWPNPTAGTVQAAFELSRTGRITLSVIDAVGRELLRPIDDEPRTSGRSVESFETAILPEGTYFLRLETETGVQTRRIVIMR